MNEGIQEYVIIANLVFVVMTAIYSLVFQLMLLFNYSLITMSVGITAWLMLVYTLITGRGLWAFMYAKIHRALTGINVLGITKVERLLLMPYVIEYAITMALTAFDAHPILNLALRIMAATPMFIMISEFAVLPHIMINNRLEIP
ncbi:MAG: hypothetical protein ACP5GY_02675 [Vulcanisaeta sp.]